MIRPLQKSDIAVLGSIWLEASLTAHDFISSNYWQDHLDDMMNVYIPNSDTYVYDDGEVKGFLSIMNSNTIAALFVKPELQGRGVGGKLIAFAKEMHPALSLTVYSKNIPSRHFYEKHGFVQMSESTDEATNEPEILMTWSKETAVL